MTKIKRVEAKEILAYNVKRLYNLSFNKYPYLYRTLRSDLQKFLIRVINYWASRDNAILSRTGHVVYFLGTQKGTVEIRNKTTKGVTNRWINYLCAMGLLNKSEQPVIRTPRRRVLRNVTGVNRSMLAYSYNDRLRPINTFKVEKYTTEFLMSCDERTRKLQEKGVTPGNISYNMLALNGLRDIAEKVYLESREMSELKKLTEVKQLTFYMDSLIAKKGYTTKQELFEVLEAKCNIHRTETKKLFALFKNELWIDRTYKAPSNMEKELYKLKNGCWIIKNKGSE